MPKELSLQKRKVIYALFVYLPALMILINFVAYAWEQHRGRKDKIERNTRHVVLHCAEMAIAIQKGGFDVLPIQDVGGFRTLDIYVIRPVGSGFVFESKPRYGEKGQACPGRLPIAAMNSDGEVPVSGIEDDYRVPVGVSCIRAAKKIRFQDKLYVLVVDIDYDEVVVFDITSVLDEVFITVIGIIGLFLFRHNLRDYILAKEKDKTDFATYFNSFVRIFPDGGLAIVGLDGKIVECNTNFARMDGKLSARELIGTSVDQFFPGGHDMHQKMRESFASDLVERPVVAILNGNPTKIFLSVSRVNGFYLARIRFGHEMTTEGNTRRGER